MTSVDLNMQGIKGKHFLDILGLDIFELDILTIRHFRIKHSGTFPDFPLLGSSHLQPPSISTATERHQKSNFITGLPTQGGGVVWYSCTQNVILILLIVLTLQIQSG